MPALGGWLVTGHAPGRELLGPRTGLTVEARENLVRASLGHMMLTSDGDDHTRQRGPFERHFRMREVGGLFGEAIAAELDELMAAMRPAGECELGAALAEPFAVRMTGRVLGLSLGDAGRIGEFYTAFAEGMVYDGNPRAATARRRRPRPAERRARRRVRALPPTTPTPRSPARS